MLEVVSTNQFKKDLKLAIRRGYKLELLKDVVDRLADEKPLDPKHRDHELVGNYAGFRECHIAPDWLLIYRVDQEKLLLFLTRNGTHSDLF